MAIVDDTESLINNAARFITQGYIQVLISTDTISVVDTACGLQGGNDSDHGLGLLIVNRLCTSYVWSFSLAT
ncbi:hypothetical protein [Moritella sp. F3]|uniref:hypothetical protein n=1 Tax=Moritella sp. F3 TaxID=2718882 RepID=UPI0018E1718A|nr:hypothetical protein [Moritella sp. F3]GIC78737.1 hypothetical protein FMO001_34640 [Moritella sp. F1]GIC82660.1 hypothetical protein FMO003_29410 [Moritella sp. F3]